MVFMSSTEFQRLVESLPKCNEGVLVVYGGSKLYYSTLCSFSLEFVFWLYIMKQKYQSLNTSVKISLARRALNSSMNPFTWVFSTGIVKYMTSIEEEKDRVNLGKSIVENPDTDGHHYHKPTE